MSDKQGLCSLLGNTIGNYHDPIAYSNRRVRAAVRVRNLRAVPTDAWSKTRGRRYNMREWHKPTIEETESGMEVTSYLPAELDRA
jgi:coenzyme PQQ precursor peptide PqqA